MDLEPPKKVNLFFNLVDCELCKDINVRRAIAYAINREEIIDLTKFGLATPSYYPIPAAYPWAFNPDAKEPEHDIDMANQILDDAGYTPGSDGMRFSLTLTYQAGYTRVERPNEVLKEQLKAVGIDLVLNPLERNTMIEEVHHQYNFELYDHLYSAGVDPALGISRTYVCSSIDDTKQFVNVTRYCNERIDELFSLASSIVDLDKRAEYYYEIQEILLEDLPVIDLFLPSDTSIGREAFVGLWWVAGSSDENWDWIWWVEGEPMEEGTYEPVVWLK
jgi:peptide/nickel transport system substrate-binding protein